MGACFGFLGRRKEEGPEQNHSNVCVESSVQAQPHMEAEFLVARREARARAKAEAEARSKVQAQESYDAEVQEQSFYRVHLASAKKATEDAVCGAEEDLREEERALDPNEDSLTYHKKNRMGCLSCSLSFTDTTVNDLQTDAQ